MEVREERCRGIRKRWNANCQPPNKGSHTSCLIFPRMDGAHLHIAGVKRRKTVCRLLKIGSEFRVGRRCRMSNDTLYQRFQNLFPRNWTLHEELQFGIVGERLSDRYRGTAAKWRIPQGFHTVIDTLTRIVF